MAAKVSVRVPIWLILIRIELAIFFWMPSRRIFVLVTNKSSPTNWMRFPSAPVSVAQPSQSFSAMPSSIDRIGYLSRRGGGGGGGAAAGGAGPAPAGGGL